MVHLLLVLSKTEKDPSKERALGSMCKKSPRGNFIVFIHYSLQCFQHGTGLSKIQTRPKKPLMESVKFHFFSSLRFTVLFSIRGNGTAMDTYKRKNKAWKKAPFPLSLVCSVYMTHTWERQLDVIFHLFTGNHHHWHVHIPHMKLIPGSVKNTWDILLFICFLVNVRVIPVLKLNKKRELN